MSETLRTRLVWGGMLLALTLLSAAEKIANQFRFFVYPDSQFYLLVARNLATAFTPTGTLGPAGMPFPPPGYAAMKATYPALVAALFRAGIPLETAGHVVAGIAAVAAVPLAYVAVSRLLGSRPAALAGAALTATSYGLTYWAGFVMSDAVSVALGFAVLALACVRRADELSEPGDIATGVLIALLQMSRPTYAVTLPFLAWLGARSFGWTWRRFATTGVACLLPVAAVSALWFPPPAASGGVLLRLAPVLASAAAACAALWWLALPDAPPMRRRIGTVAYYAAASAPLALFAVQRVSVLALGVGPFAGLDRFVPRDAATVLGALVGAWALDRIGRRDIGGPLLGASIVLGGVYVWAEVRDARYLIHLLPFLVPVASATLLAPALAPTAPRHSRMLMRVALGVLVVLLAAHAVRGLRHAETPFLATDYPREVAARVAPAFTHGGMLVSAQPWAYHYALGAPAWSAETSSIAQFTSYVPTYSAVLFLDDASMRQLYPHLAEKVERRFPDHVTARVAVPLAYRAGYSALVDSRPVSVYRLTAAELRSVAITPTPSVRILELPTNP